MTEDKFYAIWYAAEKLQNLTNGYYPLAEELDPEIILKDPETFVPILTYFASDPLTREDSLNKDDAQYKELVSRCNELLLQFTFDKEEASCTENEEPKEREETENGQDTDH